MVQVHVVYHSAEGHTRRLAEAVHRGARSIAGEGARLWTTQEAEANLDELDAADAIVFGCPTFMGGVSAEMKRFLDTAAYAKWKQHAWKDKVAGGFTTSGGLDGDKFPVLLGLLVNALAHGMVWVGLGLLPHDADDPVGPDANATNRLGGTLGAIASTQAAPPDRAPSAGDLATAEAYGRRVATFAARLRR